MIDNNKLVKVRCHRSISESLWQVLTWDDKLGYWKHDRLIHAGTMRNVRFVVESGDGCGVSYDVGYAIGEMIDEVSNVSQQKVAEARERGEGLSFDKDKACFIRNKTSKEIAAVYELNLLPNCSSTIVVKKPKFLRRKKKVHVPDWQKDIEVAAKQMTHNETIT